MSFNLWERVHSLTLLQLHARAGSAAAGLVPRGSLLGLQNLHCKRDLQILGALKLALFPPLRLSRGSSRTMNCTKELGLSLWDADPRACNEKARRIQLASVFPARGGGQSRKQTSHWPLPALAGLRSYAQAEERALQIPREGTQELRILSEPEQRQQHGSTGGMETASAHYTSFEVCSILCPSSPGTTQTSPGSSFWSW